ncbi:non-specific serine/threonine protein kinase [Entamoeba marina]
MASQKIIDPFDYPLEKIPEQISIYSRGLLLGQTYTGFVYSALNTSTKELINLIHVYRPFSSLPWEDVVEYHSKITHPNLLAIKEVVRQSDQCFLITEYCAFGQITDFIYTSSRFTEEAVQVITVQLLNFLQYLFLNNMTYAHLRTSNVFITLNGKIKCFGVFPKEFNEAAGPIYYPPEIIEENNDLTPNETWDIWALGVFIVEMVNGTAPFAESKNLIKLFKVVNAKIPLPKKTSSGLKNFLTSCLKKESKKRCKIHDLFVDIWMKDSLCETDVLDTSPLLEFVEDKAPYENHNVNGNEIEDFLSECPALKPINEEMYQEIGELANLKSTNALLQRLKEELEANDEMEESSKQICFDFIHSMENDIKATESQYKSVAKAKDDVYRQSVLCLFSKEEKHPESEELQNRIKDQMLQNQQLENQLLKIQDTFSKSKGGIEGLANALYGKLNSQTINGEKAGLLMFSFDKKEKTKSFKSLFVVLKSNFLFLFKSQNESSPLDVLLITKPPQLLPNEKYNKPNCFSVDGHVFSATNEQIRDEWIEVLKNAKKWYESSLNPI